MEGALADPPQEEVWRTLGYQPLLDLLLLTLHILALAVHLNVVNSYHFETAGLYEKLTEALLHLGCFHAKGQEKEKWCREEDSCPNTAQDNQSPGKTFYQFVELAEALKAPHLASTLPLPNLPVTLQTCVRLLSYLDQFSTGTYTPQDINWGLELGAKCEEDKDDINEAPCSRSATLGLQFGEEMCGRSRSTAASISTVCTESEYR